MTRSAHLIGRRVSVAPATAPSYWQPKPANGHIDLVLTPEITGHTGFVQGFQTIAAKCHIAPHLHADICEILICLHGDGRIVFDDGEVSFTPETTCFVGHDVRHSVVNDGDGELRMLFMQLPPGHEKLFPLIGRPRRPGEAAPEPFDRPKDANAWAAGLGVTFSGNGRTKS